MKKMLGNLNMAIVGILMSTGAFAAGIGNSGLCELIAQMYDVFLILRTLAFVGAAFIIAGWAWGYISKGEVKMDDLQKKGTGMLVGFILLFGIGMVLQFMLSGAGQDAIGCSNIILGWGSWK